MFRLLIKKLNLTKRYRDYDPRIKKPFWFLYFNYQIIQIICFVLIDLLIIYALYKPSFDFTSMAILYGLPALIVVFFQTHFFQEFQLKLKCLFNFFSKLFGRNMVIAVILLVSIGFGYFYYKIYGSPRILFMCIILPIILLYSVINSEWVREDQVNNLLTKRVENHLVLQHVAKKMEKYRVIGFFYKYAGSRVVTGGILCEHLDFLNYPDILMLVFPGLIWMTYNRIAIFHYSNSQIGAEVLSKTLSKASSLNNTFMRVTGVGLVAGSIYTHQDILNAPTGAPPFVGNQISNWYRGLFNLISIRNGSLSEWNFAR